MATSSRVMFNLERLKERALEAADKRIQLQEQLLASFRDEQALALQIAEWRARQEQKISDIFRQLDTVDDYRLSRFKLDDMPTGKSRWDKASAESKLRELQTLKAKIQAKSESLVPDADGNISLTTTQLREFFGL